MRTILFLLIGFPLLQVSSLGEERQVKAGKNSPTLSAAPHYWDANSWEKGAVVAFWRACPKNKPTNTSTNVESVKPAEDRKADCRQSSPEKGG